MREKKKIRPLAEFWEREREEVFDFWLPKNLMAKGIQNFGLTLPKSQPIILAPKWQLMPTPTNITHHSMNSDCISHHSK